MTAHRLTRHYAALERRYVVEDAPEYEQLVVPNGNAKRPIHRWFHLKEGFSCDLLEQVVRDAEFRRSTTLRILDPFAGGGTTPVSACDLAAGGEYQVASVHGVETNPFLHLVARTKLAAAKNPPREFYRVAGRVAARAINETVEPATAPTLSTFHHKEHFTRRDLESLLRLKASIMFEAAGEDVCPITIDLLKVALGGTVEPSSGLRRDGRTLRRVEDKIRSEPIDEFFRRVEMIDDDLLVRRRLNIAGTVAKGDARTLTAVRRDVGEFDLVVFSPPYPNNIDYTEVYKLEAWLLGGINSEEEFRQQRLRTLHSHPSLKRNGEYRYEGGRWSSEVTRLLAPIAAAIPDDRYAKGRRQLVRGYADDMLQVLRSAHRRMKRGGRLVYVVGNSLHGSGDDTLLVASDLLIARLAEMVGFDVEWIGIARTPQRRSGDEPLLRESVVYGRKR